jgi:hypothetical protein
VVLPTPQGFAGMHEVSLAHPRMRSQAGKRCLGPSMRHRRPEPVSEFVAFLVREGHVETVMIEHVRGRSGHCQRRGKPWRLLAQARCFRPPAGVPEEVMCGMVTV